MKKLFILFIAVVGFGVSSYGQASATATASATITTPISLTNAGDMKFGNIVATATAGTVTLAPAGTNTYSAGVSAYGVPGTISAAQFTVGGSPSATYAITLPAALITVTSGANTMNVDTWTSSPTPTGTLNGSGAQTISVGATLHVGSSQAPGAYLSGTPFSVSVNYN